MICLIVLEFQNLCNNNFKEILQGATELAEINGEFLGIYLTIIKLRINSLPPYLHVKIAEE